MSAELAWVLVVGAAIAVGIAGIIVPVLPGVPLILGALLVWGIVDGHWLSWTAFGVGVVVAGAAWALSYYIPGKRLQAAGIPNRTLLLAVLAGIVGFFVVPIVGLPLFFVAAVYLQESIRQRDARRSLGSTWQALVAYGLSQLIELTAAMIVASLWLVSVIAPRV